MKMQANKKLSSRDSSQSSNLKPIERCDKTQDLFTNFASLSNEANRIIQMGLFKQ